MTQYLQKARRIGYLRWRIREEKTVGANDMFELLDYVANTDGCDRAALATLYLSSIDDLRKMRVETLQELARSLKILDADATATKGELTRRISGFKAAGFIAR